MAKQLKFTFKDKEYVLEFTRRTVTEMEKKGFVAAEVENKPMSTLPALFEGAFLAHHRFEKKEVNVCDGTLNLWAKRGYLVPVKVGNKNMYAKSDVRRVQTGNKSESVTSYCKRKEK